MNEIENQSQTDSPENQVEASNQAPTDDEPLFSEPVDNIIDSLKKEWIEVQLESTITLTQLADLQKQLSQYQGSKVQLYGAKVGWVDTAALQLFLAFINTPNTTVEWVEPSSELRSAASMLGLSTHLNLPV